MQSHRTLKSVLVSLSASLAISLALTTSSSSAMTPTASTNHPAVFVPPDSSTPKTQGSTSRPTLEVSVGSGSLSGEYVVPVPGSLQP